MEKQSTNNPSLDLIAINKENWPEKLTKLKAKYPTIKDLHLEFVSGKGNEFIDGVYDQVGKTIGKTKEEFRKIINLL